jgi:hypothetical protein
MTTVVVVHWLQAHPTLGGMSARISGERGDDRTQGRKPALATALPHAWKTAIEAERRAEFMKRETSLRSSALEYIGSRE